MRPGHSGFEGFLVVGNTGVDRMWFVMQQPVKKTKKRVRIIIWLPGGLYIKERGKKETKLTTGIKKDQGLGGKTFGS